MNKEEIKIGKEAAIKEKKEVRKENKKKEFAVARGNGLRISQKHCIYICKTILGKSPDAAVARLQDVISEKRAIPMAGLEVGHKRGMAGGKFPKNACKAVIGVVKQVAANASIAGIENPIIVVAKSDKASSPFKRGGTRAKRCHLYLEIKNKGDKK